MPKSPDAFRTISEVADWLGVQAHVLRFWESKFAQVKPIKRAGGRRYYRPADMLLLGGIKKVLHDDGLTIKGAQKLLREKGVAHVADLSQPLEDTLIDAIDGEAVAVEADVAEPALEETASPLPTEIGNFSGESVEPEDLSEPETEEIEETSEPETADALPDSITGLTFADADSADSDEVAPETAAEPEPTDTSSTDRVAEPDAPAVEVEAPEPVDAAAPMAEMPEVAFPEPSEEVAETADEPDPTPSDAVAEEEPIPEAEPETDETLADVEVEAAAETEADVAVPSFRARPRGAPPVAPEEKADETPEASEESAHVEASAEPVPEETGDTAAAEAAKPRIIDIPPVPPASEINVEPSLLSAMTRVRQVSTEHAREMKPLLARLTRLRASMANPRKESHKD